MNLFVFFCIKKNVYIFIYLYLIGKLTYDEFCGMVAQMGAGTNPNVNPVFEIARQPPLELINKIKNTILKRSDFGIRGLNIIFQL